MDSLRLPLCRALVVGIVNGLEVQGPLHRLTHPDVVKGRLGDVKRIRGFATVPPRDQPDFRVGLAEAFHLIDRDDVRDTSGETQVNPPFPSAGPPDRSLDLSKTASSTRRYRASGSAGIFRRGPSNQDSWYESWRCPRPSQSAHRDRCRPVFLQSFTSPCCRMTSGRKINVALSVIRIACRAINFGSFSLKTTVSFISGPDRFDGNR